MIKLPALMSVVRGGRTYVNEARAEWISVKATQVQLKRLEEHVKSIKPENKAELARYKTYVAEFKTLLETLEPKEAKKPKAVRD